MVGNVLTAVVTLLAVALGGWVSSRGQDRSWARDHDRQWRDIRLAAFVEFVSAFRSYVAFVGEPGTHITAVDHPNRPGQRMPFFDDDGRSYKEKLEATRSAACLVAAREETVDLIQKLVDQARRVAAARADSPAGAVPQEAFTQLWSLERAFLVAARRELGLPQLKLSLVSEWAKSAEKPRLGHKDGGRPHTST
jgi:hypothetical protein